MATNRKVLGAAAFTLALAGGGVAGAVLGTPTVTNAQDGDGAPTDEADAAPAEGRLGHHGRERLATAAEALGMSEEDLRAALEEGSSIEQVAEDQGVDPQTVVDALVDEATADLEEVIERLPERMTELIEREGLPEGRGRAGGGDRFGFGLDAAATAIGITEDELRTALHDGSSIADVAAANDVEAAVVVDAMVEAASARIDEAVATGRLTEEQADERRAQLEDRLTAVVEGARPAGAGQPGAPGDAPAETEEEASGTAA
jgi:hypothetical protein